MRFRFVPALCGLLVAFGALSLTAPSFAQSPAAPAIGEISDAKLQAFVAAALRVGDLIDEWAPKIEAAPTADEKNKLKQSANTELVAAIQGNNDMTVPEYRQISQAAESDPALQERIIKMLQGNAPAK
jgi:hypothetical protein